MEREGGSRLESVWEGGEKERENGWRSMVKEKESEINRVWG